MVSGLPAGSTLNSSKVTFNRTSIPGPLLNNTVQMRVTLDPMGRIGLVILLDSVIEVGTGTA